MTGVDGPTERRMAVFQFFVVTLTGTVLCWLVIDDKRTVLAILPPLWLTAGYRTWAVERLSPRLTEYYGHAVVAGAADRILGEFRADRWLYDKWAAAGAPITELFTRTPEQIAAAMQALNLAGPPPRRRSETIRLVAVLVGLLLGGPLGWALHRGGPSLPWLIAIALILTVVSRLAIARHNRARLALVAGAMRANTRAELAALLAPPWADRQTAVAGELRRLLTIARTARPMPELRVVELLTAGSVVAGVTAGFLI
jgi:hypothetical protein